MLAADIIWPGLYIVGARYTALAIAASLLLEWLIYWPALRTSWKAALAATAAVNAFSLLLGIVLACVSMLGSVGFRTFSMADWVAETAVVGAMSAVFEWLGFVLISRRWPALQVRFRWVLVANLLSTAVCVALGASELEMKGGFLYPPHL